MLVAAAVLLLVATTAAGTAAGPLSSRASGGGNGRPVVQKIWQPAQPEQRSFGEELALEVARQAGAALATWISMTMLRSMTGELLRMPWATNRTANDAGFQMIRNCTTRFSKPR